MHPMQRCSPSALFWRLRTPVCWSRLSLTKPRGWLVGQPSPRQPGGQEGGGECCQRGHSIDMRPPAQQTHPLATTASQHCISAAVGSRAGSGRAAHNPSKCLRNSVSGYLSEERSNVRDPVQFTGCLCRYVAVARWIVDTLKPKTEKEALTATVSSLLLPLLLATYCPPLHRLALPASPCLFLARLLARCSFLLATSTSAICDHTFSRFLIPSAPSSSPATGDFTQPGP